MAPNIMTFLSEPDPVGFAGLIILLLLLFPFISSPKSRFELVNGKRPLEFGEFKARLRFATDGGSLVMAGLRKASVFRIISQNGHKTVLAPKYAKEIRSHPGLNNAAFAANELHGHIQGFEVFTVSGNDDILQECVRSKLNQSLAKLADPLSAEIAEVLKEQWTDSLEWHDFRLKPLILKMIAQLSCKTFLGDKICRNPEWLRIAIDYTVDAFMASEKLNWWPGVLRSTVACLLPSCRKLRKHIREARAIIEPVFNERYRAKNTGEKKNYQDAMHWFEEIARGRNYDPVLTQLNLAFASLHTTADLLTQALLDICAYEDSEGLIEELRKEVATVIREEGCKKSALHKLRLMDSVLKESQRLKPAAIVGMGRYTEVNVELSDKTIIPKGTYLMVANTRMWDPTVYPDPDTFDPYRFLKMRETQESIAQLVSPSPEHMAFGLGKHACPGRFYAAMQLKIILCHILSKFDLRLAEGCKPTVYKSGICLGADPFAKISVKRRQQDLSF